MTIVLKNLLRLLFDQSGELDQAQKSAIEPQIEVDEATARVIAEVVCHEISDSFHKNADYYDRCNRCENQYNQVTSWMQMGVVCDVPWYGAADYFVPMTEWMVDAIHARVMNTLFSQEPYMEAKGTQSEWVKKENGVTDFVDQVFREKIRVYDNTNFFFKQMIKIPMAILKYDRVQEFDTMLIKDWAMKFINPAAPDEPQYILPDDPDQVSSIAQLISNGFQEAGQEEVWVKEDKELVNGPHLQYIRAEDYVFSPGARRNNRLYWEGDRFFLTLHEMMMFAQQGQYREDTVEKIRRQQNPNMTGHAAQDAIKSRSKMFEAFHWYGRLPFNSQNQLDFRDPEAIEQEVHVQVSYKEKLLLSIQHWRHSRVPHPERVYIHGMYEETEEYVGRSLAEKLYQSQKYLNQFYNSTMNNAMISMQKVFAKKKSLTGEELERPEIYPGAIIEVDQRGDIEVLNMGDLKAISKDVEQGLLAFAERISNISTPQTGTVRRDGGQKTKGEIDATIYEGNIGMDNFIQRCHQIMRKLCSWTVGYYHDFMPPGFERRLKDSDGQAIFPTEENMPLFRQEGVEPYWTEDDVAGQYNWKWLGTTLNSSMERNIAISNDLMDRYLDKPMVQGSLLATWEILKRGLIARRIKDWRSILPPREAVVQEMSRMQNKAEMDQMQRNQQRIRDAVVNSLSSGGRLPAGPNGRVLRRG